MGRGAGMCPSQHRDHHHLLLSHRPTHFLSSHKEQLLLMTFLGPGTGRSLRSLPIQTTLRYYDFQQHLGIFLWLGEEGRPDWPHSCCGEENAGPHLLRGRQNASPSLQVCCSALQVPSVSLGPSCRFLLPGGDLQS